MADSVQCLGICLLGIFMVGMITSEQTFVDNEQSTKTIDEFIQAASEKGNEPVIDGRSGEVLVELDMVMDFLDYENIYERDDDANRIDNRRKKRKAVRTPYAGTLWPNAVIPYSLAPNTFSYWQESSIQAAMRDWEKYTCVKFKKVGSNEQRKVMFRNGNGCWSYIGMRRGYTTQFINLAPNCRYKSVILHEIGHAVGFYHEHTRPDRDDYVYILEQNVQSSLMYNFKKYSWSSINTHGVPYDYTSIMHYGKTAFTRNGGVTVATKNPAYQDKIGKYGKLSFNDIKAANLMYSCRPSSCGISDNDCPGDGFVGKDCKCWCPGSPYKLCNTVYTRPTTTTTRPTTTIRTTTPKPTTTTKPTVTTTYFNACRNKNSRCSTLVKYNGCKSYYMKQFCKVSCKLCTPEAVVPPLPAVEKCEDTAKYCNYWSKKGYCVDGRYKWYLAKNCMKTCGVCFIIGNSPDEEVICKDNLKFCAKMAHMGDCETNSDYMKKECKLSCNYC